MVVNCQNVCWYIDYLRMVVGWLPENGFGLVNDQSSCWKVNWQRIVICWLVASIVFTRVVKNSSDGLRAFYCQNGETLGYQCRDPKLIKGRH